MTLTTKTTDPEVVMNPKTTFPFTVTIGSESWTYTTACGCCKRPVRWATLRDGSKTWVDEYGREGCPDPAQPDAGNFDHEPIDDSAMWED